MYGDTESAPGLFKDRCVGGGWKCGLEIKAEGDSEDKNLLVISVEGRAKVMEKDKTAQEESVDES